MSTKLRILLIEDSDDDALLLQRVIKRDGIDFEIEQVCTASEMIESLDNHHWDAVLCDYMMPELSANEALDIIRKRNLDIPFIIVSGTISDETAVDMMKAGAHDYLTKNNLSRLVPALKREIGEAEQRHRRRVAEESLRESERKHRLLVQSLSDTVIVLTSEGIVSEFYSQSPVSDDVELSEHVGLHVRDLFSMNIANKIAELVRVTMKEKMTTTFEYPMGGRWYSGKLSPHEDRIRAVLVIRDVSDLKQAEEEARQAHSVAMLYQDITGHDIRNLLQAILIAADLLAEDEKDLTRSSLIHHVSEAVQETSELINSVQATAALLSTPLERTSLDFTVKSCMTIFNEEHREVNFDSDLEVSDALVNADRFLCHLLMNLFSNAVKHNNKNEKKIWTRLTESGDGYEITIADNGPGIKDDMKKNLLNPERRSGGVGILQCQQITSKYGGAFEILDRVEGEPNKGVKFRIWLPKATT
ncbi:response regulator [Candidatus Thorarchaeota archaeon]|nr:MAG: response regulator [Candidatus Thorarchaeota archaeon]